MPQGAAMQNKRRGRVPRHVLEQKQNIFKQIKFSLDKNGLTIS